MSILGKYNDVVVEMVQQGQDNINKSQDQVVELKKTLLSKIILKFLTSAIPKDKVFAVCFKLLLFICREL